MAACLQQAAEKHGRCHVGNGEMEEGIGSFAGNLEERDGGTEVRPF